MRKLLVLSVFLALAGCGTSQETIRQIQADVAEDIEIYVNQLIAQQQPYAVISAQPRQVDQQLVRSPYEVRSIDGKALVIPAFSLTRARPLPRTRAFSALKVPAGSHDLEIFGGYSRPKRTIFQNVKFEADGKYVIVEKKTKDDDIEIFISEYKPDTRFQRNEAEFYVIGKAITPRVILGGKGVVDMKEEK